ncbi:hypothetical protein ACFV3R_26765 [Streptomyces sp. NPDC059740]|uniref:hypothetical protein n=1 Tax=Streptomyces sp. NPDC059740 TaxID=3346926 RepID=UPI00364CC51A
MTEHHPPPPTGPADEDRAAGGELDRLLARVREMTEHSAQPLADEDREALRHLLPEAERRAAIEEVGFDEDRRLALAVHLAAYLRRARTGEELEPLGPELLAEVGAPRLAAAREVIARQDAATGRRGAPGGDRVDPEVLLLALHFETAWQLSHHLQVETN